MNLQTFLALNLDPRKERLAACAFARSVWHLLTDPRSRAAVECAEQFADGQATAAELKLAHRHCPDEDDYGWHGIDIADLATRRQQRDNRYEDVADWLTNTPQCSHEQILDDLAGPTRECGECGGKGHYPVPYDDVDLCDQCPTCRGSGRVLLPQTLCGERHSGYDANKPAALCPRCLRILSWNESTVRRIAQVTYENHCQSGYEQLHDALMEAGCDNAVILDHCRATQVESRRDYDDGGQVTVEYVPVIHARGCWVVDLLRRTT